LFRGTEPGWAPAADRAKVARKKAASCRKMKALLLLVLPWLSPANYIDNVGNLHFLCSELCKGASHYGLTKDKKRRSQDGCPDGCVSLTATALSPEVSAAATVSLVTNEPGLDNPAYVSTAEDGQPADSPLDSGRSNRTRARPFERSTIRSRSFKKINRALSVLRRTKSGSTVANQADQGRENSEDTTAPEGK